jgi:hypothetical protein
MSRPVVGSRLSPREPLEEVQIDFKDASTVPADPEGKQQHVVEVLNFVDADTSILLSAQTPPSSCKQAISPSA